MINQKKKNCCSPTFTAYKHYLQRFAAGQKKKKDQFFWKRPLIRCVFAENWGVLRFHAFDELK